MKREPTAKKRKQKAQELPAPRNALEEMNLGGCVDPKGMPRYFFFSAKSIDYQSARKADITKQRFSVTPRFWYIDCKYDCAKCHQEFVWTALEQKMWFEERQLWIDATPSLCMHCRGEERHLVDLRKEYDASVAAAREDTAPDSKLKWRIIEIVRELQQSVSPLPVKMLDVAQLFESQLLQSKPKSHGNSTRYL